MKIRFPQLIAFLNVALFLYLCAKIYQEHQGNVVTTKDANQALNFPEPQEPLSPAEWLALAESGASPEELQSSLGRLPSLFSEADVAQLLNFLGEKSFQKFTALQAFELRHAVLNRLALGVGDSQPLVAFLKAEILASEDSLLAQQECFKHVIICFDNLTQKWTVEENASTEKLAQWQREFDEIIEYTSAQKSNSLSALTLDGWSYLNRKHAEQWPSSKFEKILLDYLKTETVFKPSRLRALQIVEQLKLLSVYEDVHAIAVNETDEDLVYAALNSAYALNPEWTQVWLTEVPVLSVKLEYALLKMSSPLVVAQ